MLFGNGLGGFARLRHVTLPTTLDNVVAADFNRDGNADIALASSDDGSPLVILHGNGNGTFQAPMTIGTTTDVSERCRPTISTTTATRTSCCTRTDWWPSCLGTARPVSSRP